jgi:DNA-binding NarL/FixJ family response regulator
MDASCASAQVLLANPLRVVVAGRQATWGGTRAALEQAGFAVVAVCPDGATATAAVVRERAHLCLMDAALLDAQAAVAAIVSLPLAPKVVVLGPLGNDEAIFAAFEGGASGYVTPDLEPLRLEEVLRTAADGCLALAPAVAGRFAEAARPLAPGRLTDRERKVLELLAAGLTAAEIGLRLRVSSAAVRRHVSSAVRQIVTSDWGAARS